MRCFDLPICAAIYPKKGKREIAAHILPGTTKMIFGAKGCVTEVKYTGTGFLHVRREVYETIQQRLELPTCNTSFGSPMVPFFQPLVVEVEQEREQGRGGEGEPRPTWYLAEDYAFCERARRCGYKIMVDTRIRLWHVGSYRYSWEDAGIDRPRYADFTLNLS